MNKILLGMAAASAMFFATSSMAMPIFSAGLDSNNDLNFDIVSTDNDALDELNTFDNAIKIEDLTAGAAVNISSLNTNPFNIHLSASLLQPSTSYTFGASAQNLTTADVSSIALSLGSASGFGLTGSSISVYLDTDNGLFDISGSTLVLWEDFVNPSFLGQYLINDSDMFSLSLVTTVQNDAVLGSSIDADLTVPEPSVLALFGLGLVGLGLTRRRMKK